jgi:hypothetical protein
MQQRSVLLASLASLASLAPLVFAACGSVADPGTPDAEVVAGADAAPGSDGDPVLPDAPAAPECTIDEDCDSGLCGDGACITEQAVPCVDAAPAHATSAPADVTITYTDGAGWSEPAACEWTCNPGRCRVGDACLTDVPDLAYDPGDVGSHWFGGDDRDLDDDGVIDIRSVGVGQGFVAADAMSVTGVGLYLTGPFTSAATGEPHGVTVALDLRRANGEVLATATKQIGAGFDGGWVAFDLIATVPAGNYIVTAYVPGVFANQNYKSGIRTDFSAPTLPGDAFVKELTAPGAMQPWTGWTAKPDVDHALTIIAACPL